MQETDPMRRHSHDADHSGYGFSAACPECLRVFAENVRQLFSVSPQDPA